VTGGELDHQVGDARDLPVVRDDEHRTPGMRLRVEQLQDLDAGLEVQLARGLVSEQDRVSAGQRPAIDTRCCSPPDSSWGK
jgi:hypothetical protein